MDLVERYSTYLLAAADALATGDYDTAATKALAAQAIVPLLPNLTRSAGAGGGSQTAIWSPDAADKLLLRIRQAQAAATGVVAVNIESKRPDAGEDSATVGNFNT